MGRFKSFSEAYMDPASEPDPFVVQEESQLQALESEFSKEHGYDDAFWEDFWEKLGMDINSDLWEKFNDSLEKKWTELWDKDYVVGYDKEEDTQIFSPLYKKIESETKQSSWRIWKREKERRLSKELMMRHKEDFWKIYKETIDALHRRRGKITGTSYGV